MQGRAEVVVVQPQGVYATIRDNSKECYRLVQVFTGTVQGDKAEAARKVERDLGAYNPAVILALGNYYMLQKNFEKAFLYQQFAIFRTQVDIAASNDVTLADVIDIFLMSVRNALLTLSTNDQKAYLDICQGVGRGSRSIPQKVISLETEVPRNYDMRWASLHSLGALTSKPLKYSSAEGLKKIIREHRAFYISCAKKAGLW